MATTPPAAPPEVAQAIDVAARRYAAAAALVDQRAADESGVTLSTCEGNFVNLLRLHGPLSPSRLGRYTALSSSGTITGVIDRLEHAGYVERARCTRDRRKVIVSLGADVADTAAAARSQRLADVLADFDSAQLGTIAEFLTRLADREATAAVPGGDRDS